MICYKVVDKKTRLGFNAALLLNEHLSYDNLMYYANKYDCKQFFPVYSKGAVVTMAQFSVGLMCFANISEAEYLICVHHSKPQLEIIEVEPRFLLPYSQIITNCGSDVKNLIYNYSYKDPIKGTLFFQQLTVLT